MNEPERRKVSLAGLGLLSAGAVLGLTLSAPGPVQDDSAARPPASSAPADPAATDPPPTPS
ncbi:hypothetical protein GCM10010435_88980 [Winogradskya consettensis]|uniref:Uncharacterized protein n=1 Tax=Winogradskya consettensis TaxID=113560 RepID=A0A919SRD6_9ACTN|nr:hypothetical protein [Actinoplanes consettensis]GIM77041.1 hypothetical protein Aco04nite_53440 [Actinoplanes consettensis]